jgi:Protein of unknown function (DUF2442)
MVKRIHEVRVSEREIDRAMAQARKFEATEARVVRAEYQAKLDVLNLYFPDGLIVSIPRNHLQGLEGASRAELSNVEIVGNGSGLHWPLLDVDHYVLGLLQHRFGAKRWAAEIGQKGGMVRSEAKTKAARRNGLAGGRPRVKALQTSRR